MNAILSAETASLVPTLDPKLARAEFFFDLDLMELSLTIPKSDPRAFGAAKH
jgi:hypothetical protein